MLSFALVLSIISALAFYSKTAIYIIVYHFLHSKEDDKDVQRALWEVESDDVGQYKPPGPGDDRTPCPGLNTLANHGYLPRSGRFITGPMLVRALQRAYNLSLPLAGSLTYGGIIILGQAGPISLADFARHNRIEHDASLIHKDTPKGQMYAPTEIDEALWKDLVESVERPSQGWGVPDIARLRVRREAESGEAKLTVFAKTSARAEASAVLSVFGRDVTMKSSDGSPKVERVVPLDLLTTFFHGERLPEGWEPSKQTLLGLLKNIITIGKAMEGVRAGKLSIYHE